VTTAQPIGRLVRGRYQTTRREVLESVAAPLRSSGARPRIDPDARRLTARIRGVDLEVAFRTRRQLFGAHLHAVYTVRMRGGGPARGAVGYRWGLVQRRGFVARRASDPRLSTLADRLNEDRTLHTVMRECQVRAVGIAKDATGWVVHLEPVPGVITVMYVPPLPPFAVRMKPAEVDGHVETLCRLTDALAG
jgi:hypothetical protein